MDPQDPEERIAELERQLSQAKAAARESYSPPTPYDTALAAAPRKIPFGFVLAEILPFRWWYVFTMFMVAVAPIIVWMWQPLLCLPAAVLILLAIYGIHIRSALTRIALLKWGQVATVIGAEVISQGTYYGGTTYSNVVLPVARGWTVTRQLWSGPKTKTRIRYRLDDFEGDITVGGREYVDGVVLADQRKPQRALCVTSFPYDLDRDGAGNWAGRLRVRLQIGMACWLLIMVGWVGGAALLYQNYAHYLASFPGQTTATSSSPTSTTTPEPGADLIINGANESRSIVCDGNDVTVNGSANRVDVTGHCRSVTVSGSANHVSVEVADTITANGVNNEVTFSVGSPQINSGGISNVVKPG